jgi:hypothetical protein
MSQDEDLALLLDARTALLTAMRDNAGKPDYTIDGQSVSWSSVFDRLAVLNQQIAALQGPVVEITEGCT